MDALAWLNRLGIILNFLAGFLLAPELIGIDRLRKAEASMEAAISRLLGKISRLTQNAIPLKKNDYWRERQLQTMAFFLGILGFSYILKLLGPNVAWIEYFLDIISHVQHANLLYFVFIYALAITLYSLMLFSVTYLLKFVLSMLVKIFLAAIVPLFSFVLNKLYGDDALRSLAVYFGVVFFVIGNLLQLIATF